MKPIISLIIVSLTISLNAQQSAVVTLPYVQDFEGSVFLPTDWEAFGSNTNAAWEHSTTVGGYGNSSGSAYFDNFSSSLIGNYYGMRAVSLDLTNAILPKLKFDVAYARKSVSNSDKLGIWYSYNGTTGWVNLSNFQNATLTTAPDQTTYFTPTNSQWVTKIIDLTTFAGKPFVRFAFENNCADGNVMYIDNVQFYDDQFTGIELTKSADDLLRVFPNPVVGGTIWIQSFSQDYTSYEIYGVDGKLKLHGVFDRSNPEAKSIPVEHLTTGMYILKIKNDEGQIASKSFVRQ